MSGCTTYEISSLRVELKDLITDKPLYHSAETMNITAIVDSNQVLENVTVSVQGLKGKLNLKENFNLEKGLNQISLTYRLPRCNVCGGINEGDYDIKFEISYGEMELVDQITIRIRQ
jgi:hypothetical protein